MQVPLHHEEVGGPPAFLSWQRDERSLRGAMRLAVATALGLAAMELVAAAPAPIIRTHLYPHEMAPVQEMDVDSGSGDVGNPGRTSGGTLMLATGTTQYTGPAARDQYDEWAAALEKDRDTQLTSIGYDGGAFDKVPWTQTSYIQVQAHPFDRYFYDPVSGKYTVKRFLDDLKTRYGGIDSVLLWPTYPNIGVDDRDQFDYFRMMPGGLAALKKATGELKAAGVNVLWGYNPWDTGTRRETDSDEDTLASMLKQTDGDGFNGDTMVEVPEKFWSASTKISHPLALEPENGGAPTSLNWDTNGWGYWYMNYRLSPVPIVDRLKWLTKGKWMTHLCERWSKDRNTNLQHMWFNGIGYVAWENVWGVWNGVTDRDGEAIRRVSTMLRFLGGKKVWHLSLEQDFASGEDSAEMLAEVHAAEEMLAEASSGLPSSTSLLAAPTRKGLMQSPGWTPHTPETLQPHVYASRWPAYNGSLPGILNAWTLINTGTSDLPAHTVQLDVLKRTNKSNFYDCYLGNKIEAKGKSLRFPLERNGFGCVLEVEGEPTTEVSTFLSTMSELTKKPLSTYTKPWSFLPQTLVPIAPTPKATAAPKGMVFIPHAAAYRFKVTGTELEPMPQDLLNMNTTNHGVDVQFPWETHPQRDHDHTMSVGPFYMDKYPVTNERYAAYLTETGYEPKDARAHLQHWKGKATMPPEVAKKPVTFVSLNDARNFCRWAGGRLPHTYEWQYAAQGTDGRKYPWGDEIKPGTEPGFHSGSTGASEQNPGPEDVGQHSPQGDSPFGVVDMVGNVWQYTSEFNDDHTRAVVLRGGSNYRPAGSNWYFPNQPTLNMQNKYFLFDDAYERAGTIGFRCVVDA